MIVDSPARIWTTSWGALGHEYPRDALRSLAKAAL
jgi:hypothetical protein